MIAGNLEFKRLIIGRMVFSFFFLTLLLRFFMDVTPSGMLQPVLYRYNFDFTYWAFDISGLLDIVLRSKAGSIFFDILLFISCFLCILYPLRHYYAIVFGILFFIYFIAFNSSIVHHAHPMALMTLASIPFFFKHPIKWRFLWDGFRYYVCFAYFITFVWKAFFGKSLFFWGFGLVSTQLNLVEYLYHFPDGLMADIYRFFITNPILLNIGLIIVFLIEGFMIIGFFTKRLDYLLIWIPLIVHLSTYLFSDVYFFEMIIGMFAFLPPTCNQKMNKNSKSYNETLDSKAF